MRRQMLSSTLLIIFLLVCSLAGAGQNEVKELIVVDATVKGLVEKIDTSISNTLNDVNKIGSEKSIELRMGLMILLSEVENVGDRLSGKRFTDLDSSHKHFFENILRGMAEVEVAVARGAGIEDVLVNHVEQLVKNVPFEKNDPQLRRVLPVYVVDIDAHKVRVIIKGRSLNHGKASLNVGDSSCDLVSRSDPKLEFLCDSKVFTAAGGVSYVSANLGVTNYMSQWERLSKAFAGAKSVKQYRTSILVIPRELGTYKIYGMLKKTQREYKVRKGTWGHKNPYCWGSESSEANFKPASKEWKIQVDSIKTQVTKSKKGSHKLLNVSEEGFQVYAKARNIGSCYTGSKDSPGVRMGTVAWKEQRDAVVNKWVSIAEGRVLWGKDIVNKMPSGMTRFKVTIKKFDGRTNTIKSSSKNSWYSILHDKKNKIVTISPAYPDDIFRHGLGG